jgi:site-specific recombinase XerD
VRFDHILIDPSDEVVISWRHEKQHKDIFSYEEIDTFLSSANTIRDRVLFELIYSSGLRVSEVCKLSITDLDFHERMLLVQDGKGGKDRFVPYSQTAACFLDKYIKHEREKLLL